MNHLAFFKIVRYRNSYYIFLMKKHRYLTLLGKFSYFVNTVSGSQISGFYLNFKKINKLMYTKKIFFSPGILSEANIFRILTLL
jgi:hypothetical protein